MTIPRKLEKALLALTALVLVSLVILELVSVFLPIKPFWVDEWFIIYNLKSRTAHELWGQLAFYQQFPRAFLVLVKWFTSFFQYSYWSLRLPSCIISIASLLILTKLSLKIYPGNRLFACLFVTILASSNPFLEYFVETKQYPLDHLACIMAVWQLAELIGLSDRRTLLSWRWVLLCVSFIVLPFTSYVYIVAIFPVFFIIPFRLWAHRQQVSSTPRYLIHMIVPLALGLTGLAAFYFFDLRFSLGDPIMRDRWNFLMFREKSISYAWLHSIYPLFSQVGSGLLFETIFGFLGITGFLSSMYMLKKIFRRMKTLEDHLIIYSVLIIIATLALYFTDKIPLGTPRLNLFTVIPLSVLIIFIIRMWANYLKTNSRKLVLPIVLMAGTLGNIVTFSINSFTGSVYRKRLAIYRETEKALE